LQISPLQTTSFRLTVFAVLAFIVLGAAALGFLHLRMLLVIDRQIDGALQRECVDMIAAHEKGGYERLRQIVSDRASPSADAMRIYLLIGPDDSAGNLSSWPDGAPKPGESADVEVLHASKSARVRTLDFPGGVRLLVGRALSERTHLRNVVAESLFSVTGLILILGVVAGTMLALYARRRLGQINAMTQAVLEGNLSGRVAVGEGGDEYDQIAQSINAMLDRIQGLIATVRGVTENIAHDLRTPLNRLRGRLEVALMSPRSEEDYRAVLKHAIAESETIVETFNSILKIARIKSGALALPRVPVDLAEVVRELVDLFEVFGEESGVHVEARLPSPQQAAPIVLGDAHLISQAAANLLDNAIKYSSKGTTVVIEADQTPDGVSLNISDSGPGIPANKRAAMLDRFVRLESTAGKQGFGLGLSFVAAVAEWHGTRLELSNNEPGLRATLRFPCGPGLHEHPVSPGSE
jgi:signal transduction histidine kinase